MLWRENVAGREKVRGSKLQDAQKPLRRRRREDLKAFLTELEKRDIGIQLVGEREVSQLQLHLTTQNQIAH